jgi:hypothetical protein
MTKPHRDPGTRRRALACLVAALLAGSASAESWSWFVEPFTVSLATEHPQAGPMEGVLYVSASAVRSDWTQAGQTFVTVLHLDGDGAIMWAFMPDGTYLESRLAYGDAPELFDQGYVAAVTDPDDPRHPCVATPEIHRCEMRGTETVDGRELERWRIEAEGQGGAARGQDFWFDRAAGVVVRAVDDSGATITYLEHRAGPVDASVFEVPDGYQRIEVPAMPPPGP